MKQFNNKLITIVYVLLYSIFISLSLATLIIFRPFKFVNNEKSQIVCKKNGAVFDIGPNYIYTLDDKLDPFNDKKARKLCEYGIIRDYGDSYKGPNSINYGFKPVYATDSSWGDVIVISSTVFLSGALLIELLQKIVIKNSSSGHKFILYSFLFGLLIFILIFRKPASQLFCLKQFAKKVTNFRNAAFKNGVYAIPEEDRQIRESFKSLFKNCMKEEGYRKE